MVSTLLRVTEVKNIVSFRVALLKNWRDRGNAFTIVMLPVILACRRVSMARATPVSSFFRGYKGYFLSFVTIVTEFVQAGHSRYVVCTLGMICFI